MKRQHLITLCLALLLMGLVLCTARFPRPLPRECYSELYLRYEHCEGVRVGYIKDFQVNDTLALGVTLLEATDSAGWARMIRGFNIESITGDDSTDIEDETDYNSLVLKIIPRGHPEQPYDTLYKGPVDFVAANVYTHSICIFHTDYISLKRAFINNRLNTISRHQDNIVGPRNSREVGPSYATPPMPFYKRTTTSH